MMNTRYSKRPTATHTIRRASAGYQVVTKVGACVAGIIACATYTDATAAVAQLGR